MIYQKDFIDALRKTNRYVLSEGHMRILATDDYKNYIENGTVGKRPSVRGIIIKAHKIALVHSLKYDYYKFPGGGINEGEKHIDTLIREVAEEAGLVVIRDSIVDYGVVIRKEKGKYEDLFVQENYYYFCDVQEQLNPQSLDDYEAKEEFALEWVDPQDAIEANMHHDHKDKNSASAIHMMEREAKVLQMLVDEARFS
jgi:8-oxo-dGTP pyrophosphatase MutT (NUDIX family)